MKAARRSSAFRPSTVWPSVRALPLHSQLVLPRRASRGEKRSREPVGRGYSPLTRATSAELDATAYNQCFTAIRVEHAAETKKQDESGHAGKREAHARQPEHRPRFARHDERNDKRGVRDGRCPARPSNREPPGADVPEPTSWATMTAFPRPPCLLTTLYAHHRPTSGRAVSPSGSTRRRVKHGQHGRASPSPPPLPAKPRVNLEKNKVYTVRGGWSLPPPRRRLFLPWRIFYRETSSLINTTSRYRSSGTGSCRTAACRTRCTTAARDPRRAPRPARSW